MTNLITKRGGEICAMENSSVIKSASHDNDTEDGLVLHINYVHECIKHGELIDLSNFNGENFGMKLEENDLFLLVDGHHRLQVEHNYARRNCFQRQSRNTSDGKNDPYQTEPEITNNKTPTIASAEITIIRRWVGGPRNGSFTPKQNSPELQVEETNLTREAEKESGNSLHRTFQGIAKSFDEIENMPLYERLQGGQGSQGIISDRDTSPRIGSRNFQRKTYAKKRGIDNQPVACNSRTAESTMMLRNESNQDKILGNAQASRLTSSNSENIAVPGTRMNTSRVANNDALISDNSSSNSDPMSDDEVASSSSRRADHSAISHSQSEDESKRSKSRRPSSWIERQKVNQEERKDGRVLTRNFSLWEQHEMVNYLIDNKAIGNAKGNVVWQQMLQDGFLQHRTYQSLNNHFRKKILPHIHRFPMSSKCLRKFQRLR